MKAWEGIQRKNVQEAVYRVLEEGGCVTVGLSCEWWPPATAVNYTVAYQ